jgi:CO/xanthine dehydrogenase FAD-binding subunit
VLSDGAGLRARLLETGETGTQLPDRERLEALVAKVFTPKPDLHASVEYKRYMAGVLTADAVHALRAAGEAT